jgi:hypothetical protein
MNATNDIHRRRLIAGFCLIGLALFFVTNPLTALMGRAGSLRGYSSTAIALSGFAAPLHMLLMIGSVYALTRLLRHKADRLALAGAALALMGWSIGLRILALRQVSAVLENGVEGVPPDAIGRVFGASVPVFISLVPIGLMFPIGLILLGVALVVAHPLHRGLGVMLAVGGVLFPMGRAIGIPWAFVGCDLLLGATFGIIGWQVLTRPALWNDSSQSAREATQDLGLEFVHGERGGVEAM